MALWMELYPRKPQISSSNVRNVGCVIVDRGKIVALGSTGEAHAVVRSILGCSVETKGCDVFVSRFPCALCVKLMVQAGIARIFYFPSSSWELGTATYSSRELILIPSLMDSPTRETMNGESSKQEANFRAVSRLITNNAISLTLYIPKWSDSRFVYDKNVEHELFWELDQSLRSMPNLLRHWDALQESFAQTQYFVAKVIQEYVKPPKKGSSPISSDKPLLDFKIVQHAMVMAHLISKRTNDLKVGVGAVIIGIKQNYISVGWNSYPTKSSITDYPQDGADNPGDDEALKYSYILHAGSYFLRLEQNAFLWRMPHGTPLDECILVSTKMPCDECSPVIYDCGIRTIITNKQIPKSLDDPSRLRGLTYEKISKLIPDIWIF